jgi:GT2 family glycosyltransferase
VDQLGKQRVSVIVVTHDHEAYVDECLGALCRDRSTADLEIIVVDNRSEDSTVDRVNAFLPDVALVVNETREGFAANNNKGMALAGGEYLLLLNPDTRVTEGAIDALADFMERRPEVGICGAQLLNPDGSIQLSHRRFPTLWGSFVRRTPLRRLFRQWKFFTRHYEIDGDQSSERDVDWLLGACMMARRAAVKQVGLMDEGFRLYVEDIDWCYRMWQGGWKVAYAPSARIYHEYGAVTDKHFLHALTLVHCGSMWRFVRKYWFARIPLLRLRVDHPTLSDTSGAA